MFLFFLQITPGREEVEEVEEEVGGGGVLGGGCGPVDD